MNLAEALAERTDCQKRLEVIKRTVDFARIQEEEEPAEDPNELSCYQKQMELMSDCST